MGAVATGKLPVVRHLAVFGGQSFSSAAIETEGTGLRQLPKLSAKP
jgi:hypothetical protein